MAFFDMKHNGFQRQLLMPAVLTACCVLLASTHLTAQDPPAAAPAAEKGADAPILSTTVIPKYAMPVVDGTEDRNESRAKRTQASTVRKLITTSKSTIVDGLRKGDTNSISGLLDDFMNGYLFALMGQNESASLSSLGEQRRNFLRTYLYDNKIPPAARQVVIESYTIPKMQEFIDGNYHQGVRMNAVVLMGLLNSSEGDSKTLPIPSAPAFKGLLNVFTDAKYPSYLKVGALAGLQRHFEVNRRATTSRIDPADMTTVANQCLAIVQDQADGQDGWPEQLNYWLKRRATQSLGAMGKVGDANANAKALANNLYDEDNPNWIRFDSLVALSKLDFDASMAPEVATKVIEYVSGFLEKESAGLQNGVDDLVTINLLYEDKDLLLEGSAKRSAGRDAPNAGMGMGEDSPEGGSNGQGEANKPKVELPTYQLNDSRKRVKAVVFTALQFFDNDRDEGILRKVPADKRADFLSVTEVLGKLLTDSDVGIIDLSKQDEDDEEDEEAEAITQQLAEIYKKGATELDALVVRMAPPKSGLDEITGEEEAAEETAVPPQTPPDNAGNDGASGN